MGTGILLKQAAMPALLGSALIYSVLRFIFPGWKGGPGHIARISAFLMSLVLYMIASDPRFGLFLRPSLLRPWNWIDDTVELFGRHWHEERYIAALLALLPCALVLGLPLAAALDSLRDSLKDRQRLRGAVAGGCFFLAGGWVIASFVLTCRRGYLANVNWWAFFLCALVAAWKMLRARQAFRRGNFTGAACPFCCALLFCALALCDSPGLAMVFLPLPLLLLRYDRFGTRRRRQQAPPSLTTPNQTANRTASFGFIGERR